MLKSVNFSSFQQLITKKCSSLSVFTLQKSQSVKDRSRVRLRDRIRGRIQNICPYCSLYLQRGKYHRGTIWTDVSFHNILYAFVLFGRRAAGVAVAGDLIRVRCVHGARTYKQYSSGKITKNKWYCQIYEQVFAKFLTKRYFFLSL